MARPTRKQAEMMREVLFLRNVWVAAKEYMKTGESKKLWEQTLKHNITVYEDIFGDPRTR